MRTDTRHAMGALGDLLDPTGPRITEVSFTKTELAALTKAADILERLRALWGGDDNHPMDTDVALAIYTIQDLVEAEGLEL